MNKLLVFLILSIGSLSAQTDYQNGDIIFRKDRIFSKWNSIGVIFIEDSIPTVYYSDGRVNRTTLKSYTTHKRYQIKRIDEEGFVTIENVKSMLLFAKVKTDSPYSNISFVWDLYRQELGVPLCKRSNKTIRNIHRCYFLD
jgi:hypothetical protein